MKMRRYLFLLLTLLVSCTSEIELEQSDYETKIVVDGFIETNAFARVYLTLSSPFLTDYDSASIASAFLKYGKVTLTCVENGDSEVLTTYKESAFFPPYVYKTKRMKGIAGYTYQLTVEVQGRLLTSTTTIPEAPSIVGLRMDAVSDTAGYLYVNVQPNPEEKTYIFIQIKSILADENMHPARMPVYLIQPGDSATEVSVYRTRETNLYVYSTEGTFYQYYKRYEYALTDTLLLQIGAMDVASYQVMKSIFADLSVQTNPFAFNTAGIQSNIEGGIGHWTGLGAAPVITYTGN
jgi:hypothetical protein